MRISRLVLPLLLAAGIAVSVTGTAAAKGTTPAPQDLPTAITLSASPMQLWPTMTTTITAIANADVGPTPDYLSIYDMTDQAYVATCASGTTCSVGVTSKTATTTQYVAYVGANPTDNSAPPPNEDVASPVVGVNWFSVGIGLTGSSVAHINDPVTLTATTSRDVGSSPFYIEIYDVSGGLGNGILKGYCASGTSCSISVTASIRITSTYVAYVAPYGAPPNLAQAQSNQFAVTWINPGQ